MHVLLIVLGVFLASLAALMLSFLGYLLMIKILGKEKFERYTKMRMQGPFVPLPKNKGNKEDDGHEPR